jgi:RNA polymerase sigma-70 factor, ECF subfamily
LAVNKRLIHLAKAGNAADVEALFEPFRTYLKLLARMQIGARIQGKADESDIVQEAFLDAHLQFDGFQGQTEAELVEWLRTILAGKLAGLFRRYLGTQQRDVRLEQQISDDLGQSTLFLGAGLRVGLINRRFITKKRSGWRTLWPHCPRTIGK